MNIWDVMRTYATAGGNAVFVAGGLFLAIAAGVQIMRRARDRDMTWYGLEFLIGVALSAFSGQVTRIGQWLLAQIITHPVGPKGPGTSYAPWIWETRGTTTVLAAFVFVLGVSLCMHAATRKGSLRRWMLAGPVFAVGFWILGAYMNKWAEVA